MHLYGAQVDRHQTGACRAGINGVSAVGRGRGARTRPDRGHHCSPSMSTAHAARHRSRLSERHKPPTAPPTYTETSTGRAALRGCSACPQMLSALLAYAADDPATAALASQGGHA